MLRVGSKLSRLNVMRYRDTERDYCQMTVQSEQCMDLLNIDVLHSHLTLPRILLNFNAFDFLDPPYGILTSERDRSGLKRCTECLPVFRGIATPLLIGTRENGALAKQTFSHVLQSILAHFSESRKCILKFMSFQVIPTGLSFKVPSAERCVSI